METREIEVDTGHEPRLVDLTDACARFLAEVDARDGRLSRKSVR